MVSYGGCCQSLVKTWDDVNTKGVSADQKSPSAVEQQPSSSSSCPTLSRAAVLSVAERGLTRADFMPGDPSFGKPAAGRGCTLPWRRGSARRGTAGQGEKLLHLERRRVCVSWL